MVHFAQLAALVASPPFPAIQARTLVAGAKAQRLDQPVERAQNSRLLVVQRAQRIGHPDGGRSPAALDRLHHPHICPVELERRPGRLLGQGTTRLDQGRKGKSDVRRIQEPDGQPASRAHIRRCLEAIPAQRIKDGQGFPDPGLAAVSSQALPVDLQPRLVATHLGGAKQPQGKNQRGNGSKCPN